MVLLQEDILRMGFSVSLDKDACNGCEDCLEACTTGVFEMRNGKSLPVNADECIGCQSCVEICEQNAITVEETGVEMSDTCKALLRGIP
jgi:NAD-dependent dihydropyrimidine dehydrogenase PreA subunit